eukprot:jgi/Ulvmu1/8078/UM004_0315.1
MTSRASTAEVYGFVGYLTSFVAYGIYVFWLFTDDKTLEYLGITYYPSKEWGVIVPTWLCVGVVFLFWVYESYNMMSVPSRDSWTTIIDDSSSFAARDHCFPGVNQTIPPLNDIPPHVWSQQLHGRAMDGTAVPVEGS